MDRVERPMPNIHPTAVVEPGARIAASARIGPYCVVGPKVEIGEEVELVSHVVVAGRTSIGDGTRIFPFASIGHQPQDLKYKGEDSALVIGKRNIIRLQRRGFSRDDIQALRSAYDMLFAQENGTLAERVAAVAERFAAVGPVREIVEFVRAENSRGLVQPKSGNGG